MGFDSTAEFLEQQAKEDEERRAEQERQRRMMENFGGNIPEQLRDSTFKRPEPPFSGR
jgi:hypothetical protein